MLNTTAARKLLETIMDRVNADDILYVAETEGECFDRWPNANTLWDVLVTSPGRGQFAVALHPIGTNG